MGTKETLLKMFAADPTIRMATVADIVGVSRQRVHQICRAEGLPTNNRVIGAEKRSEYLCWWNMMERCLNPKNESFGKYGAAGITVCLRWRDFHKFYADMGPRPSRQYSLDRFPDNQGNYEPSNCRWATRAQQQQNRPYCKITAEQVPQLRARYARGESKRSLAKAFNMSPSQITRIVRGEAWK